MPGVDVEEAFETYMTAAEAMHLDFEGPDRDAARAVELAEQALAAARRWNAAAVSAET